MPCCALALLAVLGPRLLLVLGWVFDRAPLDFAFRNANFLIPLAGFLFLPWTTLAYAFAANSFQGAQFAGLDGTGVIIVVAGLVIDVLSHGGGWSSRRRAFA